MSGKFDTESLLRDIETLLKAKLNAVLISINDEKADDITLRCIEEDAYFLQALSERMTNHNPFLFYGVQDIKPDDDSVIPIDAVEIFVNICIADEAEQENTNMYKLLRYIRALKEVVKDNFGFVSGYSRLKVRDDLPASFRLNDAANLFHAAGVIITATIGH